MGKTKKQVKETINDTLKCNFSHIFPSCLCVQRKIVIIFSVHFPHIRRCHFLWCVQSTNQHTFSFGLMYFSTDTNTFSQENWENCVQFSDAANWSQKLSFISKTFFNDKFFLRSSHYASHWGFVLLQYKIPCKWQNFKKTFKHLLQKLFPEGKSIDNFLSSLSRKICIANECKF